MVLMTAENNQGSVEGNNEGGGGEGACGRVTGVPADVYTLVLKSIGRSQFINKISEKALQGVNGILVSQKSALESFFILSVNRLFYIF